jgi:hypothetical protein
MKPRIIGYVLHLQDGTRKSVEGFSVWESMARYDNWEKACGRYPQNVSHAVAILNTDKERELQQ